MKHLALTINLVPHFLNLVRENIQLSVVYSPLRLPLSLILEKVTRDISVKPSMMGALP